MKNFFREISYKCNVYEIILGVLFSTFCILGKNYRDYGSYKAEEGSTLESMLWFLLLLVIAVLGIQLLDFLLIKLFRNGRHGTAGTLFCRMDANQIFRMLFVVFLVLWLPYFIIQFPGSSWYDSGPEINQCWGVERFNGMHPLFQTLLTGASIKLGVFLGSANYGVAIYIAVQLLLAALVLAYGIKSLYEICNSSFLIIFSIIFWGLNPVIPLYLTAMGKDVNWSAAIFLLLVCFMKISVNPQIFVADKAVKILYPLSLILVCLLRNAGIAIAVIFAGLVIYVSNEKARSWAVLLTGGSVLLIAAFHITVSLAFNVDHSKNEKENLSTPLLQVARYVNEYPEEVTRDEKQVIDNVVSYEAMVNDYRPDISDSIKDTYRKSCTSEDKKKFWNLYAQYFRKHPLVFVDAIGAKSIGYFDPFTESKVKPFAAVGLQNITGIIDPSTGVSVCNYFDLEPFEKFVKMLQETPVLKLISRCGFWMWIFLFALAESLKHKIGRLAVLPTVVFAAGLTATPVNAYFRYNLPLVFVGPLYLAMIYLFQANQAADKE